MIRSVTLKRLLHTAAVASTMIGVAVPAFAQAGGGQKPNILFIMGDDIGWMQPSIYHRGLMVGETPNIDRIGERGRALHGLLCRAELHLRAQRLLHGHASAAHGHDPAAASRQPVLPAPGTPALASFCTISATTPASSARIIWAIIPLRCRRRTASRSYWGYLYHLDAMQQVSFPDINSSPTRAEHCATLQGQRLSVGLPGVSWAVDPRTTNVPDAAASGAGVHAPPTSREGNQSCHDEGPLTLDRSKTVDEEISAHVVDFLDRNDPRKTNKPFFVWYNPARMHITTMLSDKYLAMVGTRGGKDWGVNEAGMKQMDDNIGVRAGEARIRWDSSTTPSSSSPPTTAPRSSPTRTAVTPPSKAGS